MAQLVKQATRNQEAVNLILAQIVWPLTRATAMTFLSLAILPDADDAESSLLGEKVSAFAVSLFVPLSW